MVTRRHVVERLGHRLVVEDHGDGPPIVLLHGLVCSARLFDRVVGPIAEAGFRVVVPEVRGHGASSAARARYDLSDLAADALAVFDALGIERPLVVGFSMGGMTALEMWRVAPQRVAGLVMLSTSAEAEKARGRRELMALGYAASVVGVRGPLAERVARALYGRPFRESEPGRVAEFKREVATMTPSSVRRACRAVALRRDALDVLASIDVPVSVVVGSRDRLTPPGRSETLAEQTSGRLRLLEDVGHSTPEEAPTVVVDEVLTVAGLSDIRS